MDVDVLFAWVPVKDFQSSRAWYDRFFGRPADVVAHEHEVMWHVAEGAWLYIVLDDQRAGSATVAMAVHDIEAELSALRERGIATGPIEDQGDAGRKCLVIDPDGNSIAILGVRDAA